MTTFNPRNDNVLVLGDAAETKRGTLYLPATHSAKIPSRGTVIAVGPGYILADGSRAPIDLTPDERVEFHLAMTTHQIRDTGPDGEEIVYFLLKECDIMAVVTDEPVPPMLLPGEETEGQSDGDDADAPDDADATPGRIILAR